MSNILPHSALVGSDVIIEGLLKAPQFSHHAEGSISDYVDSLYVTDAHLPSFCYTWAHEHKPLLSAFKSGHLTERLYYAHQTIASANNYLGAICLLCNATKNSNYVGNVDESLSFKNALSVNVISQRNALYPDIYCRLCRSYMSTNYAPYYTKGYTHDEAVDLKLIKLLQMPSFKQRVRDSAKRNISLRVPIERANA